jgi:glycopeptide antibiotics resistance protein
MKPRCMCARRRSVALWCWWMPLVWLLSFPWGHLTSHPQWQRVHWIPLTDPADKPRDIIANLLLFVPFGYSVARRGRRTWILHLVVCAAGVSISAEALQLYGTARYPSATDVLSAVTGAIAGGQLRRSVSVGALL